MRFFASIFSALSILTTRLVFAPSIILKFLGLLPCNFPPDAVRALENGKMFEESARNNDLVVGAEEGNGKGDANTETTTPTPQQLQKQQQEHEQQEQQQQTRWDTSRVINRLGKSAGMAGTNTRQTHKDAADTPPRRPSLTDERARNSPAGLGIAENTSTSPSPFSIAMPSVTLGHLAFSALQFVPVPMLVLDDLKTVVLANDAMGALLGIISETPEPEANTSVLDLLRGQSLSQVGVDMVQDGRPVWIDWEQFFESLVSELGAEKTTAANRNKLRNLSQEDDGDVTPTVDTAEKRMPSHGTQQHPGQSAVIEVIISRKDINRTSFDSAVQSKTSFFQTRAKMIVTIFEVEGYHTYFSLTFTNTESDSAQTRYPISRKSVARAHLMEAAERQSFSGSNPPSSAGASDVSSPPLHSLAFSPSAVSLSSSPFPPLGPPARTSMNSAPSILQKVVVMKDALIDGTETPILAMWKDGSVTFPNKAARKLFRRTTDLDSCVDGHDLLPAWTVYDEDFTTELEPSEFPISVLLRTETPFQNHRIGMYDADGNKRVFDVLGQIIRDDVTDEFLAGVVTCRDVTNMAQLITRIKEEDEERFQIICDAMPQLVWTTTAEGYHDFYNNRWYEYTGLTEEESLGEGWMKAFHPEDLAQSTGQWEHCLRTGAPYQTEYRCLSKEGEWKWFIGRALPLRSKETGQIEKWFGTCTDANEILESRHEAKRTRQQLLSVIAHAQVTVFQVDLQRRITMLEGALMEDALGGREFGPRWYIGEDVYQVFSILSPKEPLKQGRQKFLEPVGTLITGQPTDDLQEHMIGKPLVSRKGNRIAACRF
jgi:PAS domain S-box-containing protein